MSRSLVVCISLLLCGVLAACDADDGAGRQKIGVVNINRILVDSEPGKAAAKYMEDLQDSLRNQASELQKKLQAVPEKDGEDDAKQKEVQMEYIRLQSRMQAEQQNVNNILNDVVHRVVEKYRITNGYSLIIFSDVALSFEQSVDVTSGITMAMNAEKVEFKPLPEPKLDEKDTDVQNPAPGAVSGEKAGEKTTEGTPGDTSAQESSKDKTGTDGTTTEAVPGGVSSGEPAGPAQEAKDVTGSEKKTQDPSGAASAPAEKAAGSEKTVDTPEKDRAQ